jgi:hypothetical protein
MHTYQIASERGRHNAHHLVQALLVHGALDHDVQEVVVEGGVRRSLDGRVEGGVFVVLHDRADDERPLANKLEAGELGRGISSQWWEVRMERLTTNTQRRPAMS